MRPNIFESRLRNSQVIIRLKNMLRRHFVKTTSAVLWKVLGAEDFDGNVETIEAEIFQGVNIHARPAAGTEPEVIAAAIGANPNNTVIIACRDQKALASVLSAMGLTDINADESLIFVSGSVIHQKDDGTVEIRSPAGTAAELALKSDVDAIWTLLRGWTVAATDGGLALQAAALTSSTAVGTTVLKGE